MLKMLLVNDWLASGIERNGLSEPIKPLTEPVAGRKCREAENDRVLISAI